MANKLWNPGTPVVINGDGASKTISFDLVKAPIGLSWATIMPTGILAAYNNDGTSPVIVTSFSLLLTVVTLNFNQAFTGNISVIIEFLF